MIKVTKNGNIVAEYEYDPEGLRVVKKAKGETTHYVFQGTEPIFEKRIETGKIKSFVYALGKHLARVDGTIGDPDAKKYWYVTDHLGSIRAVTDKDGKKVWSADYLAFGKQFGKDSETDFEELHSFTGKEYDPDTGLHYYNARWYDSELGRFVSEDPAGDPNNPNLYVMGRNNPLGFVDPTGCISQEEGMALHAANSTGGGNGNGGGNPGGGGPSGGSSSEKESNKDVKTKYYKDGTLKSVTVKDPNGRKTFHFNKEGKLSYTSEFNNNNGVQTLTYFHKDGVISETTFNSLGNMIDHNKSAPLTGIDSEIAPIIYMMNGINNPRDSESGWTPESWELLGKAFMKAGYDVQIVEGLFGEQMDKGVLISSIYDSLIVAGVVTGLNNKYAETVVEMVKADILNGRISENQAVIFFGYSGGGEVAIKAAAMLSGTRNIDAVITVGSQNGLFALLDGLAKNSVFTYNDRGQKSWKNIGTLYEIHSPRDMFHFMQYPGTLANHHKTIISGIKHGYWDCWDYNKASGAYEPSPHHSVLMGTYYDILGRY